MAGRKPRTEEVKSVFANLKHCNTKELQQVIDKATAMIDGVRNAEIEAKKAQIETLKAELAELEK